MPPLGRVQVLGVVAVTALVLFAIARFWAVVGNVQQLPARFTLDALTIGVIVGLLLTLASGLLYQLWPRYRQSADTYLKYILAPLLVADIPWLGILPGLSEELLFRGVMLPALGAGTTGLLFSSVGFGALHMADLKHWPYMIWATVVGGILGYSALATGNLMVPLVAHAMTNIVSALVWKLRLDPQ